MKSRRWIALVFGTGLLLALAPRLAQAQATSASSSGSSSLLPSTSSSSGGGGGGSSASSGGSTAQGISAAVGSGLVTSTTTISATSGTPTATSIPSSANYLGSSYVNYYTLGLPATYQGKFGAQNVTPTITGTFGKYIYVPNPSNTTGTASTAATQGIGFGTFGQPRAPAYSTAFAETFPIVRPELSQVQADARDAIARSSMLKNKAGIQVAMNGAVVLLSGAVGSETERAVAEGMVRMTPGVQDVQNNLVVDLSKK